MIAIGVLIMIKNLGAFLRTVLLNQRAPLIGQGVRPFSTAPTQGIRGQAALITGDFKQFTVADKKLMQEALRSERQLFVVVNDRNTIQIPANERAHWIRKAFNHDQRLQVMVVYGAAELSDKSALLNYSKLIQTKLPKIIDFSSLYCQNHYSPVLAQLLSLPHYKTANTDNPTAIISGAKKGRLSQMIEFPNTEDKPIDEMRATIESLNPDNHPNKSSFFQRIRFDLNALNKPNLPIITGRITDPAEQAQFSSADNVQVYDMPIYVPGKGWRMPKELTPYASIIDRIVKAEETSNPNIGNCFAYLTIDSGIVAPNHFARRRGLHVDGFVSEANQARERDGLVYGDNTYIVCDDLGTQFYSGPFDLSQVDHNDPNAVLKAFEAQGKKMSFVQAEPYTIYRLTVNNVHAVHPNDTGEYRQRAFLKCTFSVRPFNRQGSTINPLFDGLKWQYVPRDLNSRNTQNYAGACPQGFLDTNLSLIQFNNKVGPAWCGPFFYARKKLDISITAIPAIQGSELKTVVGSDLITTNYAGPEDMEVIRQDGDRYFLPQRQFHDLYKLADGENRYTPRRRELLATRIAQPLSVIGIWGTRQNLPANSVIVHNGNESWGVHPESFEATYESCKAPCLRSPWYS